MWVTKRESNSSCRRRISGGKINPALRRLGLSLFLDRSRILALGGLIAIDEFDYRHWRTVAIAEAGFDDPGIATLAVLVAARAHVKQLADHCQIAQFANPPASSR